MGGTPVIGHSIPVLCQRNPDGGPRYFQKSFIGVASAPPAPHPRPLSRSSTVPTTPWPCGSPPIPLTSA